jgi:hypothetical protein
MTNFAWSVSEYGSVVNDSANNGAGAVLQAPPASGTSGAASVAMSAFGGPNNATYGVTGIANGGAITPGAGFLQLHQQASATTINIESEWRTDNSATVGSTFGSVQWAIIGVEIVATGAAPTVPGQAGNVLATAGNAQATVSWSAPSNGGSGISKYVVTSSPDSRTATVFGSPPATTATVTGLANNIPYTFTVTASNGVGTGSPSAASNSVTPSPAPVQITENSLTAGNSAAAGSSVTTAPISPTANSLELAAIESRTSDNTTPVPTLSGCFTTWTELGHIPLNAYKQLTLFRAQGTPSPSSCSLTFTFPSSALTNFAWTVTEYGHVVNHSDNGAGAIGQVHLASGTSGTASVAMAAFGASNNATYGLTGIANAGAITAGGSFTQLHQQASATTINIQSEWRTDNSATVSSSFGSIQWAIFGVEIAAH